MGSFVSWMTLALFWCGGAFWVGSWMITVAPRLGMAACLTLSATSGTGFLLFSTSGLLLLPSLLAGTAIARRRAIACGISVLEQPR
jgi:hypothetical protein